MKPHPFHRLIAALCVLTGFAVGTKVEAASVSLYGVGKTQNYVQTTDTTVAPETGDGFSFTAFAVPASADSVFLGLLQPPGAQFPQDPLSATGDILSFDQSFATQAEL